MAFLTLNGLAIPVSEGGLSERILEVGTSRRVFAGQQQKIRRALKRSWRVNTPPMSATDALMIERFLQGLGEGFSFDDHPFTSKGRAPNTFNAFGYKPGTAADGLPVLNQARFGSSIAHSSAVVNLLTANQQSVETDTTGFSAVDLATISRDTTYRYIGSASLKVITSAAVNGTRGGMAVLAASTNTQVWAVSAYVMAPTAATIRVVGRNNTTATDGTPTTVTLTPYTWQRVSALTPTVNSGQDISLRVLEETADSGITFYVDALQINNDTTLPPRPFNGPSTVPAYFDLDPSTLDSRDFTFSFWSPVARANGAIPFALKKSGVSNALVKIDRQSATTARLYVRKTDGNHHTQNFTVWTADESRMVTVVVQSEVSPHYAIYVDGALVSSGNTSPAPDVADASFLYVANEQTSGQWDGALDDLIMLPFGVTAAVVAGWYGLGKPIAEYPRLWLGGDAIPDGPVLVYPQHDGSRFLAHHVGGSFQNAARSLSFTLEEA